MTCNATPEHLACTQCSLHKTRQRVVPGHGNIEAEIALIGEAPGATEDKEGLPFVGRAGRLLDDLLVRAGIDPTSVYKDNVISCKPMGNDIKSAPDAVSRCPQLWLLPTINSLPNLRCIVVLGATAGQLYFPGKRAMELAQLARTLPSGVVVVGSPHPAYAIREGAWVDDSIVGSLARAMMYAKIK